jgi:hypothetical protein
MPILKKPTKPAVVQSVAEPRQAVQPVQLQRPGEGSSMVLAQLAGQNAAIAQMLNTMTGRRVVEATVSRDESGLIKKISMVIEPEPAQ